MKGQDSINLLSRYHGERYTFFYLFYHHYTAMLIVPTIAVAIMKIWQWVTYLNYYSEHYHFIDAWSHSIFSCGVAVWGTYLVETWRKKENDFLYEWDLEIVKDSVEKETVRKDFKKANKYDPDVDLRVQQPDGQIFGITLERYKGFIKINIAKIFFFVFMISMLALDAAIIFWIESGDLVFSDGPFQMMGEAFSHSSVTEVSTQVISTDLYDKSHEKLKLIEEALKTQISLIHDSNVELAERG